MSDAEELGRTMSDADALGRTVSDAEELGRRIGEIAAARRGAGEYEGDLERWMDEHFRRIVGRPNWPPMAPVRAAVAKVQGHPPFHLPVVHASNVPGGAAILRAVGLAIRGHLFELVDQLNAFADAMREAVNALADVVTVPGHIIGYVQSMDDRLAEVQRTVNRLSDAVATGDAAAPGDAAARGDAAAPVDAAGESVAAAVDAAGGVDAARLEG